MSLYCCLQGPSLVFTNIGFLISTPGCSEAGSLNDLHIIESNYDPYHQTSNKNFQDKTEYEMINEEEFDHLEELDQLKVDRQHIQKQDSRNSVTSGDYEEILLQEGEFENEYKSLVDTPPPLPPRKSNNNSPSR